MSEEIEAAALVEMVRQIDAAVTRTKLKRWHNAGLIDRPRNPGKGRGKGSLSYYPVHVMEAARVVAGLLQERRDFEWAGWKLWLMDYPVADRYWRPRLEAAAELWDGITPKIRDVLDSDGDELSSLMKGWLNHQTTDPTFAAIRKAVGPKRFEAAMAFTLDMASGYDVETSHDRESKEYRHAVDLVDLVLGLRAARTDHLPGGPTLLKNNPQFVVGDYLPLLTSLGRVFAAVSWTKFLAEISLDELNEAKRELVNILGYFAVVYGVVASTLGPDAFGLRRAASLRDQLSNGRADLLILGWAIWRRTPGVKEGVLNIKMGLEAGGLPQVWNMERAKINVPDASIDGAKLKRTRKVYPHQEWINYKRNS